MILGLNPDSALLSLYSKLPGLQRICMILGLNPGSVLGSWSFQKTGCFKCLQKLLIHDAKLILEILLFGSWSSKLPGLQQICMILGQNLDSVLGSWSSKHLQTTLFTIYLHDLGTKSRFSFRIRILQTSCFTAYLHDLGTKSRFNFWILILQKKGWNKCIRMSTKTSNPRCKINFGNLTFRILTLQTTWFWVFLHDFGTKSTFNFGILILQTTLFTVYLHDLGTKPRFSFRILILQTSWFTAYLHDLGTKSRFSFWILILQKKDETNVFKSL